MEISGGVQKLVHRFNEDEAVWRRFQNKRAFRRLSKPLARSVETVLDELDWIAAEREKRETRAIGRTTR